MRENYKILEEFHHSSLLLSKEVRELRDWIEGDKEIGKVLQKLISTYPKSSEVYKVLTRFKESINGS